MKALQPECELELEIKYLKLKKKKRTKDEQDFVSLWEAYQLLLYHGRNPQRQK